MSINWIRYPDPGAGVLDGRWRETPDANTHGWTGSGASPGQAAFGASATRAHAGFGGWQNAVLPCLITPAVRQAAARTDRATNPR